MHSALIFSIPYAIIGQVLDATACTDCSGDNGAISAMGMRGGADMLAGTVSLVMAETMCLGDLQVQLNISERGGWGVTVLSGWGDAVNPVLAKALLRS